MKVMFPAALVAAALLIISGCGIPKDQYNKLNDDYKNLKASAMEEKDAASKKIAELDKNVGDVNKEKEALNSRIKSLEENLSAKQVQINELMAEKAKLTEKKKQVDENYDNLMGQLKGDQFTIQQLKGKLSIKMADKILFASGSSKLNKEGNEVIKKLAEALKSVPNKMILVEGNTDNIPLGSSSAFRDNWDLSAQRALAVVRSLQDDGIDPTRLVAAGMSQYQPVALNTTDEGRSKNRRIEVLLIAPDQIAPAIDTSAQQPAPAPAAK
jgi:chemotaxis protein MotB